jgi:1-acyl-sn-glycerol-3-phosphate acyltransferase
MQSLTDVIRDAWDSRVSDEMRARIDALDFDVNDWGYDDLGLSVDWLARVSTVMSWLYRNYFRVQTRGMEYVPEGPALIVGNHSTQMAYDGFLVLAALILDRDPPAFAAPLGAHQFARNPLYSVFMPRLGQVTGTPANGRMLLERGRKVMVFPEGENGGGKTIFNGYKLMPFGKGFMRLAYTAGVPIVPFAFVGGEEMVPSFSRMEPLARKIGMKYFPLSPTGALPLPTKCSIQFGPPLEVAGDPADEAAVAADVLLVENEIRRLTEEGLKRRTGVFL